jgi:hypothetical protein
MRIGDVAPQFAYLDEIVELLIQDVLENRPASIDEVKMMLLAKQNAFISRQINFGIRLCLLPAVTDPFLESPIDATDVDVRGNILVAVLNQGPPRVSIKVFNAQLVLAYVAGAEPTNWNFFENQAVLNFRPQRLEAKSPAIF